MTDPSGPTSGTTTALQQGVIKFGVRTAFALMLFLALAAIFGAILFAIQRLLGMPVQSWENAVFIYLVVATGLALLSFWISPSDQTGPAVRLNVPRPANIETKD